MDLFRKKSVDQLVAESTPLKRTMRTFDLTMLGIGAIIGTGIFVLTGKGALTAGPALSVSFLLAAVCCGFAGLCYAEFAAMAPVSGSAYSYAYLAFGELIAFVIGWDLILEYALQAATVSAGWSGYFNKLLEGFGLHLPVELTAAYGTTPGVTTYFNLPGFVIVLIITWVLSIGINQTKRTNDVMVLIKLAIIVLFIVCAVPICTIFCGDEPDLIALAAANTLPLCVLACLGTVSNVMSAYFQAIDKVVIATVLGMSRYLVFTVPCIMIMSSFMGINGVWWAQPVADVLCFAFTMVFVVRELRRLSTLHVERASETSPASELSQEGAVA